MAQRKDSAHADMSTLESIRIERELPQYTAKITSLDPRPRQDINRICDIVIRRSFESWDLALFDQLALETYLSLRVPHRAFPNSDVVVYFLEVMPRLKPGVIVHLHDIFVPDGFRLLGGTGCTKNSIFSQQC